MTRSLEDEEPLGFGGWPRLLISPPSISAVDARSFAVFAKGRHHERASGGRRYLQVVMQTDSGGAPGLAFLQSIGLSINLHQGAGGGF
jgi:hypothetical protein